MLPFGSMIISLGKILIERLVMANLSILSCSTNYQGLSPEISSSLLFPVTDAQAISIYCRWSDAASLLLILIRSQTRRNI